MAVVDRSGAIGLWRPHAIETVKPMMQARRPRRWSLTRAGDTDRSPSSRVSLTRTLWIAGCRRITIAPSLQPMSEALRIDGRDERTVTQRLRGRHLER